jgi:DNA-binding MarR family transcriptional regulator
VANGLRSALGRLGRLLRLAHADSDLTPSQYDVLATIAHRGPMRLSELVEHEGLNPTMLSRVVGKLEAFTLISRASDPVDGRVVHLEATPRGRALYLEIRGARTEALGSALRQLSAREREALGEALPVLETLIETLRRSVK